MLNKVELNNRLREAFAAGAIGQRDAMDAADAIREGFFTQVDRELAKVGH